MLGKLYEFIGGLPTNSVLKEHRAFLLEQLQAAEDRMEALKKEKAKLEERIRELESQVAAQAVVDEFVEHRGALFKKAKAGGGYLDAIYCPNCRVATSIVARRNKCLACGWTWKYKPYDFTRFAEELAKK